jgi:NADP-dependent 3-hydroxy acid dehydrogenase YdfG/Flp pilus assembly protein TadD
MTRAIIAYCVENQFAAAKMIAALEGKAQVDKVIFDDTIGISHLEKYFNNSNAPILMLISDNFLKSENCMNGALELVQKIGAARRLIPVTTDGVYPSNGSGKYVHIPTTFDRVSNVIQYMNYWQDKYLDMRKAKPNGISEADYSDQIRSIRNISSEVGEMLRYMRAMEYYSTDQFEDSSFSILHRILGIFSSAQTSDKKPELVVSQTTAIIDSKIASDDTHKTMTTPVAEKSVNGSYTDKSLNLDITKDPDLAHLLNANAFKEVKETVADRTDMEYVSNRATIDPSSVPLEPEASLDLEALIEDIKKDTLLSSDNDNLEATKDSNIASVIEDISNDDDTIVEKTITNTPQLESIETLFTPTEEKEKPKFIDNSIFNNTPLSTSVSDPIPLKGIIDNKNLSAETEKEIANTPTFTSNLTTMEKSDTPQPNLMLEDILQNEPKNALNTEGVDDDALLSFREAVDNNPTDMALQFEYANKLVEAQQYQEAIEQLELLVELDRTNIDAYMLMAYAAEQSGDYLLSLNCLEKVTLLKPDYPGIFYKLGTLVNERFKGPKRKALRYFSEAVKHNPSDANAHFQLAKLEMESGSDKELVVAHLEDTLTHNPTHAEAAMELAKVHLDLNNKETAADLYARAWAIHPNFKTENNDELFKLAPVVEPEPEPAPPPIHDNGMVVMITGATSGIGKATADIFAKHGYRLILTGRRNDRLDDIKGHLSDMYHNRNITLNFDVRDNDAVTKALLGIDDDFKNIDILINNAGLASGLSPIQEGNLEDWDKMIDTNIKGLLYMTRAIAPHMVERKKGHIINVSSIAGKEAYPNGNVYCASKHAVDSLTRSMRLDLFKHNIRVSQVSPGAVEETEFSLVRFHGDSEKAKIYEEFTPLKASDVAETLFFIASRAEYINIQDIVMTGTQQASANFFDKSGRTDM